MSKSPIQDCVRLERKGDIATRTNPNASTP
jgi:hypothetical protein